MNDLRYSLRSLMRMRGVAARRHPDACARHRRDHDHVQRRLRGAAAAAAVCRSRSPGPDLHHAGPRRAKGSCVSRWSRPLIDTLTASVTSYESIASFTPSLVSLSGGDGDPEQIDGEIVSPEYFGILRVTPAMGRTFTAAEDGAPGDAPVAILSDRSVAAPLRRRSVADWRHRSNQRRPLTVVGIMPAGFAGLSDKSEIWIPRTMAPQLTYAEYLTTPQLFIAVVARLKDGVTLDQANAELASASATFELPDAEPDTRWGAVARACRTQRTDRADAAAFGAAAARGRRRACCSSRARTSRGCCLRADGCAHGSSRSGWRSVRAVHASSGSC